MPRKRKGVLAEGNRSELEYRRQESEVRNQKSGDFRRVDFRELTESAHDRYSFCLVLKHSFLRCTRGKALLIMAFLQSIPLFLRIQSQKSEVRNQKSGDFRRVDFRELTESAHDRYSFCLVLKHSFLRCTRGKALLIMAFLQ